MQMDHTWLLYLVAMSLSKMVFALWKMGCYCSVTKSCPIVWTAACQASLSFTIYQSLLKLMSIESMMPSNHLVLCCPLLLLPVIFPSIRVFSNESVLQVAKVLELQLQQLDAWGGVKFVSWLQGHCFSHCSMPKRFASHSRKEIEYYINSYLQ